MHFRVSTSVVHVCVSIHPCDTCMCTCVCIFVCESEYTSALRVCLCECTSDTRECARARAPACGRECTPVRHCVWCSPLPANVAHTTGRGAQRGPRPVVRLTMSSRLLPLFDHGNPGPHGGLCGDQGTWRSRTVVTRGARSSSHLPATLRVHQLREWRGRADAQAPRARGPRLRLGWAGSARSAAGTRGGGRARPLATQHELELGYAAAVASRPGSFTFTIKSNSAVSVLRFVRPF